MQNNSSKDYYSFEMPVKLIIEETLTDNITKIFWRFVKMMRNRGWLIAVIIGIALMTTVCYFTIQRNTRTEYTNGRII